MRLSTGVSHLGIQEPQDYYGEVTGTVVMMTKEEKDDLEGAGHEKIDDGLKRTAQGIILYPQPQNDPNDPLNWPVWRRDLALGVIGFHSFIIGGQTAILAAVFNDLSEQFGVPQTKLAYLVGAYMLVLGFGSVIFAPLAVKYGKRLVYLVALCVWLAGSIWAGASHSFNSLLGARIIMGLGGSPTEALPSSSIAEIYFLHERAYRLGIYTLLLLGGKNIMPMVAGFIMAGLDWNWLFWIETMVVGMNLVLTFFFVPETFWDRPAVPKDSRSLRETKLAREARANSLVSHTSHTSHTSHVSRTPKGSQLSMPASSQGEHSQDSTIRVSNHDSKEESDESKDLSDEFPKENGSSSLRSPSKSPSPHTKEASDSYFPDFSSHHVVDSSLLTPASAVASPLTPASAIATPGVTTPRKHIERHPTFAPEPEQHDIPRDLERPDLHQALSFNTRLWNQQRHQQQRAMSVTSAQIPKKKYVETLKIYNGVFSKDKLWMIALRPFVLFAYPGLLFSTVIYALSVVWLIVLSEVLAEIFQRAPYDFPVTSVALLFISTFIGGCIGSAIAGRFSDVLVRYFSRRNDGIYEPEYRLVMIIPVMFAVTAGMMGFGWSSFDEDHWIVPTIFLGITGFGCSLGSTTAITYAVDSYKMFASEVLVTMNLTKNVLGFLFSLFVPKFNKGAGSKTTFLTFGGIELFVCLFGLPLYIYGKRLRRWTDEVEMMSRLYVVEPDPDTDEDNI